MGGMNSRIREEREFGKGGLFPGEEYLVRDAFGGEGKLSRDFPEKKKKVCPLGPALMCGIP